MKTTVHISWVAGLALGLLVSAHHGFTQSPDGPPGKHLPLPKPINLKVLPKDIQTGELIELMYSYSRSLGVQCEFCHVQNADTHILNFADDSRVEKNTARIMIRMTNEINAKYVAEARNAMSKDAQLQDNDQQVTCATCHRGHSQPEAFVPGNQQQ